MRIAVVGAGRIGALHARCLARMSDVDLVIADLEAPRADDLATQLGCRSVELDSLWEVGPTGLVIASPSPTHGSLVDAALDAGIAVLCEKPLTTTMEHSLAIAERSRQSGVPVLVGLQRRFDGSFRRLREQFAARGRGGRYVLRLRHSDTGVPPADYLATSGGIFLDMCIHDFDAVRWMTGCEVETVTSAGLRLTDDEGLLTDDDLDTAVCTLRLADGSLAIVEAFRKSPHGYLAEAEVTTAATVDATLPRGRQTADWMERFAEAFQAQIEGFVATLDGGAPEGATASDAVAGLRVALTAERAYGEGRPVTIDEIG